MSDNGQSSAKEFLLKEYDYISGQMQYSEDSGEKRLTFFMSIVTAVLGADAAFQTYAGEHPDILQSKLSRLLQIVLLGGLLLIGLIVYARLLKRNWITEEYKRKLDLIRKCYSQNIPLAVFLEASAAFLDKKDCLDCKTDWSKHKITSLDNIVFIINAALGAFLAVLVSGCPNALTVFQLMLIFVPVILLLQVFMLYRRLKKGCVRMEQWKTIVKNVKAQ